MISLKQLLRKAETINRKTWIWIGLAFAALWSLRIYYVQEMLAALIAFSLLFLAVSAVVLAVFFLVRIVKPIIKPTIAWVTPKFLAAARQSVNAVEGALAKPAWAPAVPGRFRSQRLKLNEKCKTVYLRFAGFKSNHVYRAGLRAGGAALTVGCSARKRISTRLGNWLTEKVTYSDLVHLVSISQVRTFAGRRASANSRNQTKRRSSPAVLTHSSVAGTGSTATDSSTATRAKTASAGNT